MAKVTRENMHKNIAEELQNSLHRALVLAGYKVARRALDIIEEESPDMKATGHTARSIFVSPVQMTGGPSGMLMHITVGPRTEYAKWGIGFGRAPGTPPPLLRIYQWVVEKPRGAGRPDWQNWAIARAVQKKIAEEGSTQYFLLERALAIERPTLFAGLIASVRYGLTN